MNTKNFKKFKKSYSSRIVSNLNDFENSQVNLKKNFGDE